LGWSRTWAPGSWTEDSHDGSIICFILKIMLRKSLREPGRAMVLACDRTRLHPRCILLPQMSESERTYHSIKSEGGDKKEGDDEKEDDSGGDRWQRAWAGQTVRGGGRAPPPRARGGLAPGGSGGTKGQD
jgi:hypothetical protein